MRVVVVARERESFDVVSWRVLPQHEADLGELCRQLGHFLKAERQLRTDEVTALREKLEHIILTAANMQGKEWPCSPLPLWPGMGYWSQHGERVQVKSTTIVCQYGMHALEFRTLEMEMEEEEPFFNVHKWGLPSWLLTLNKPMTNENQWMNVGVNNFEIILWSR